MKTPTVIGLVAVVLGIAAAIVVLVVTGHDPGIFVSNLPALAALVAALFGLDKITKNTNGTLSDIRAQNDALTKENAALRSVSTPEQIAKVAPVVPVDAPQPALPATDPIVPLADPLGLRTTDIPNANN